MIPKLLRAVMKCGLYTSSDMTQTVCWLEKDSMMIQLAIVSSKDRTHAVYHVLTSRGLGWVYAYKCKELP